MNRISSRRAVILGLENAQQNAARVCLPGWPSLIEMNIRKPFWHSVKLTQPMLSIPTKYRKLQTSSGMSVCRKYTSSQSVHGHVHMGNSTSRIPVSTLLETAAVPAGHPRCHCTVRGIVPFRRAGLWAQWKPAVFPRSFLNLNQPFTDLTSTHRQVHPEPPPFTLSQEGFCFFSRMVDPSQANPSALCCSRFLSRWTLGLRGSGISGWHGGLYGRASPYPSFSGTFRST